MSADTIWYVVVRENNPNPHGPQNYDCPILVYCDRERAELVAKAKGYRVVPVKPLVEVAP